MKFSYSIVCAVITAGSAAAFTQKPTSGEFIGYFLFLIVDWVSTAATIRSGTWLHSLCVSVTDVSMSGSKSFAYSVFPDSFSAEQSCRGEFRICSAIRPSRSRLQLRAMPALLQLCLHFVSIRKHFPDYGILGRIGNNRNER